MSHKIISPAKPIAELSLLNLSVILNSNENTEHKFQSDSSIFIGIVLEAAATFSREINGDFKTADVQAGDIFITPPTSNVHWRIKGKINCASLCIRKEYIASVAASIGMLASHDLTFKGVFKYRDPLLEALFNVIVERVASADAPSILYIETMARALCIHLLHTLLEKPAEHHHFQKTLTAKRIDVLRSFVLSNMDKKISTGMLAEQACVSKFHFCRLFKRTLSMTPQQFVRRCRLDRARALVQGTNQSVTEIAYSCGFATQSHFSQQFRESFGLSPRQMRGKILQDAQLTIFDLMEEKQFYAQEKQAIDITRLKVDLLVD
jgi:AraC family transcriptional regulator